MKNLPKSGGFFPDLLKNLLTVVLSILLISGAGIFAREVVPQYVEPVLESFNRTLADAGRVITDAGEAAGGAITSVGRSTGNAASRSGRAIADAGRAAGETVVGIGRGAGEVYGELAESIARISLPKISFPSILPTVTPTFAIQNPVVTALKAIQELASRVNGLVRSIAELAGDLADLAGKVTALAASFVTDVFEATSATVETLKATGTIIFTGRLGSHFIPTTGDTYDLGTSTYNFRNLYLGTSLVVGGTGTLTTNFLSFSDAATLQTTSGGLTLSAAEGLTLSSGSSSGITLDSASGTISFSNDNLTSIANLTATGTVIAPTLQGDLSCTDCVNATEVEDLYLFNTGDTATGDYDFGSGTLFIDSTNNRVGIGSTSPSATLTINGTADTTVPVLIEGNRKEVSQPLGFGDLLLGYLVKE